MRKRILFLLSLLAGVSANSQSLKIFGKVTNAKREPLALNQFKNPVQFKIGITTWDRKRGKWL